LRPLSRRRRRRLPLWAVCLGAMSPGGSFSILGVIGDYRVNGKSVIISITKKSLFLTDSFIQKKIAEFFR